ncbi:hypothetical protein JCM14036_01140 [Desulfotomaculum defluvii]
MGFKKLSICFVVILFLFTGCQDEQRLAEEKLKQMGVNFDESTFIQNVKDNDIEIVRLFLNAGINPNAKDDLMLTPLMYASEKGHNDIIQLLLKNGAEVNAIQSTAGITPLNLAIIGGNVETIKLLLKGGADVNLSDEKDGMTPLMLASGVVPNIKNSCETVKLLLDSDAEVNAVDKNFGWSALHYAVYEGNQEKVQVLLDEGADINIKGNDGQTPLIRASIVGNAEVVQLLIRNGADVFAGL